MCALLLCFSAKPKSEIHVSMATPVTVSMETVSNQNNDQPTIAVPPTAQQPPPTIPTMIAAASPPSQPAVALSTIPGAVPITPPITTIAAAPPPTATVGGSLSSVLGPPVPEIKVKEEVEPMDIMRPVSGKFIHIILTLGNCSFPYSLLSSLEFNLCVTISKETQLPDALFWFLFVCLFVLYLGPQYARQALYQ